MKIALQQGWVEIKSFFPVIKNFIENLWSDSSTGNQNPLKCASVQLVSERHGFESY